VPIRKEGTYKVKARVWFAAESGQAVYAESERTATFLPNNQTPFYFAGALGDNANDGRDPNGFSLTNASYVEATGVLTETGKFSSYDHTVATSYGYDSQNTDKIWVDGALRRIAEKISNDAIRIDDAFKLGTDATGLTSSNGPKAFLTDVTVVNGNNIALFFLAGQEQNFSSKVGLAGRTGHFTAVTYGGTHAPITADVPVNEEVFDFAAAPSETNYPSTVVIGNLQNKEVTMRRSLIGGTNNSEFLSSIRGLLIVDRPLESNLGGYYVPTFFMPRHQIFWGVEYDKFGRKVTERRTILETVNGQDYIDINAPFDAAAFEALIGVGGNRVALKIYNEGFTNGTDDNWIYRAGTVDFLATNITRIYLQQHRDTPATLPALAAGTSVDICENRGNLWLLLDKAAGDKTATIGNILEHECDLKVYDHAMYINLKNGHQHHAWNYLRNGRNIGFMMNINNDSGADIHKLSIHDNFATHCTDVFDSGNALNLSQDETFGDYVLINNLCDDTVERTLLFGYILKSVYAHGNKHYGSDRDFPMFLSAKAVSSTPIDQLYPAADLDFVFENNDSYGGRLWVPSPDEHVSVEAYNNRIQHNGTDVTLIDYDTSGAPTGTVQWFGNNVLHTPNHSTNDAFEVDGVKMNLAEFELLTGSENNVATAPDWVDGSTGNFNSNLAPAWAGGTDLLIEPVVGQAFSLGLDQYFNGSDLTITIVQSALPAGLTLSANTITGTPTDGGGTFNLIIRATNSHGFVDSPEIKLLNRYDSSVRMTTILANQNYIDLGRVDLVEGDEFEFDFYFNRSLYTGWPWIVTNEPGEGNNPNLRIVNPGSANGFIQGGNIAELYINEDLTLLGTNGEYLPYKDVTGRMTWRVVVGAAGLTISRLLCKGGSTPSEFSEAISIANLRIKPRTANEILLRLNSGGLHNETEEAEIGNLTVTYKNTTSDNWPA
jgi:hypothetical protein